jgi:hypothetical protein
MSHTFSNSFFDWVCIREFTEFNGEGFKELDPTGFTTLLLFSSVRIYGT